MTMTTTSSHLTARQRTKLRTMLDEALTDHHEQYDHSTAILDGLSNGSGGEASVEERDLALLAAQRAREGAADVDRALARLDDGTYGLCESCGRPIPFERLEALPHARYCVACPRPGGLLR